MGVRRYCEPLSAAGALATDTDVIRCAGVGDGHVATVQMAAKWRAAAAIVKACQTS